MFFLWEFNELENGRQLKRGNLFEFAKLTGGNRKK